VYVNQFFVIRGGAVGTKHVFAGSTRMVTKLAKQENPTIKSNNAGGGGKDKGPRERDMYFYHPDHLGSSSYVTDEGGRVFQHLEYFPFGETWVEEKSNTQRTPYLFTGKELDEDTGLYYFGARYYDARVSLWLSVDPLWFKYPSWSPYNYAFHRPLTVIDPDGREGIVISGGDVDSNYKMTPATRKLETGLMNARKLQNKYDKEGNGEQVTWFVPKGTDKKYQETAEKSGIQVKYFSNSNEITTYVNAKNGKNSRSKDTISDFKYYGHGSKAGILYPADQTGKNIKLDVGDFKPEAFDEDANLFFAACNSSVVAKKATHLTSGNITGFNTKIRIYPDGRIVPDPGGSKKKIPGDR